MKNIKYKIFKFESAHLKENERFFGESEKRICLLEYWPENYVSNNFESFEKACEHILDNKLTYQEFTILPIIYQTDCDDE